MGVCVIGQMSRLELESKMRHFVLENLASYSIDLVFVLAPADSTHFVTHSTDAGGRMGWSMHGLLDEIARYPMPPGRAALRANLQTTVEAHPQDERPYLRFDYVNQSDKWQGKPELQVGRVIRR